MTASLPESPFPAAPRCRLARRDAAERTLCNSLQLALACGALSCGVLLACGPAFLGAMGASAELLGPALLYQRIRLVVWRPGTSALPERAFCLMPLIAGELGQS